MGSFVIAFLTFSAAMGVLNTHQIKPSDYRRVFVEKTYFSPPNENSNTDLVNAKTNLRLGAGALCVLKEGCLLSCRVDNGGSHFLSNYQVSPFYKSSSEAVSCITIYKEDLAFGKTITGSNTPPAFPQRVPQNLAKGFSDRGHEGCFMSQESNPWFLVDLGKDYNVHSVFLTQHIGGDPADVYFMHDLEVRVGDENVDFSSNPLLGFYKGPSEFGEIMKITKDPPLRGRYVSAQKKDPDPNTYIVICFLDIYGEEALSP